jgi:hypothetical protein
MTSEVRKKENGEELKIVQKNNLLNVEYSSCRVSGSQNGRVKVEVAQYYWEYHQIQECHWLITLIGNLHTALKFC